MAACWSRRLVAKELGEAAATSPTLGLQPTIRNEPHPAPAAAGAYCVDPRWDGMAVSQAQTSHHSSDAGLLVKGHLRRRRPIEHRGAVLWRGPVVPVHNELLERSILPSQRPAGIRELALQAADCAPATCPAPQRAVSGWLLRLTSVSQAGLHPEMITPDCGVP